MNSLIIKKIKKFSIIDRLLILILVTFFFIISLSSIFNLHENIEKISKSLNLISEKNTSINKKKYKEKYDPKKLEIDRVWYQKILKGGYILHFRHAERDKWIDVEMYDALESHEHDNGLNNTRFAEMEYFSRAVCLNERGKVQARAMGEYIEKIKLPIYYVLSSPICRSRQTANLAFGGYDALNVILVHQGPYDEDRNLHIKQLTDLYKSLPIKKGFNTIVSGHNGTLHKNMFENKNRLAPLKFRGGYEKLSLEEGGFFVISKTTDNDGNVNLNLEHQFHNFLLFSRFLNKRVK